MGHVIAIEPTSDAAILPENVDLNSLDAASVVEAAASSRSGTKLLTTSTTSEMWNTLGREVLADAAGDIAVAIQTIDEIVASSGSPSVWLLRLSGRFVSHENRLRPANTQRAKSSCRDRGPS